MSEEIRRRIATYIGNESLEAVGSCFDARSVRLEKNGISRYDVDGAYSAMARKDEQPGFRCRSDIPATTLRKHEALEHESRAADEQGSYAGQLARRRAALALVANCRRDPDVHV